MSFCVKNASFAMRLVTVEESPLIVVTILMEVGPSIEVSDNSHAIIHSITQPMLAVHLADSAQFFAFLATKTLAIPTVRFSILLPVASLPTGVSVDGPSNRIAD